MKPSQIPASLDYLLTNQRPVFLWGPPGVGKSQMVHEAAARRKIEIRDIRLNLFDPTEFKGFPEIAGTGAKRAMHFLPPALLPRSGKGVLFLDELTSAMPAMQNLAYQLVLDRRVGDYELPPGWSIVAAGNRASDKGLHYAMPPALANRFTHIDVETDAVDWLRWAEANGVGLATRAFMRSQPMKLHDMRAGNDALGMAFPSPRSWVAADKLYTDEKLPTDLKRQLIAGTLGTGVATEFLAFAAHEEELPTFDQLVAAPSDAKLPAKPGARFLTVTMLLSHVDPKTIDPVMTYVRRITPEFQAMFVQELTTANASYGAKGPVAKWLAENHSLIAA